MAAHGATSARIVRFGLYEADLDARELRRNGLVIRLQDRPFEVLAILLERPGEVIAREEFRQRLWSADTFVDFDASLNTSVNKLRQALQDNAENPRFIATAGRRGYRFIAPASFTGTGTAPADVPLHDPGAGSPAGTVPHRRWIYTALPLGAVLAAAIAVIAWLAPEPTPRVISVRQISRDGLLDPWGKLTTDGARLFYLDRAGGHWTLMQVPLAGGEAQPFPAPAQNTRVVDISPDRSELLSFGFVGRSYDLPLSLTPVVGGPAKRVGTIFADDAAFSPDGQRIFYDRADGIYSCARDGSQVKKLVSLPGRSEDPRWSRDGRRLRFTLHGRSSESASIWEVSADGGNLHAVPLNLPMNSDTCCGRWSADGRYFFFEAVSNGVRTIWAVREGGRFWRRGSARPAQLTFGPTHYGGLVAGEQPSRAYVWSGIEHIGIAHYYPASGRVQPLIPDIQWTGLGESRDGNWLAFSAGGELWRSRADGSQRHSLAAGYAPITRVVWSPDGKRVLFRTAEPDSSERFFIVPAEGGPATEVPAGNGSSEVEWMPDGQSLFLVKRESEGAAPGAQSGIYEMDSRNWRGTKIPGSEGLVHPSISPDGRFLAAVTLFERDPNQPTRIELFDARSQSWTAIAQGALVNPVQWSQDSQFLYYQDLLAEGEPAFRYSVISRRTEPYADFARLLQAGFSRCSFFSFAADGALMVNLRRNEVNVYRLDLDLP